MNYQIDNIDFDYNILKDKDICIFSSLLNEKEIINIIKNILNKENELNINIHFNFKSLSKDIRLNIFKFILNDTSISNFQILINIVNFMKNYNQFDDSFFNSELIFVNSLEEFLDFKFSLKNEIDKYVLELSKWYISLFKSVHKLEINYLDDAKEMPVSFNKIITNFDFYTLSSILSKSIDFRMSDCYLVKDAFLILSSLAEKQQQLASIMSMMPQIDVNAN